MKTFETLEELESMNNKAKAEWDNKPAAEKECINKYRDLFETNIKPQIWKILGHTSKQIQNWISEHRKEAEIEMINDFLYLYLNIEEPRFFEGARAVLEKYGFMNTELEEFWRHIC